MLRGQPGGPVCEVRKIGSEEERMGQETERIIHPRRSSARLHFLTSESSSEYGQGEEIAGAGKVGHEDGGVEVLRGVRLHL